MDYSTLSSTPNKKNHALVKWSFILGIITLIGAFTCFSFISPILGGISIILALLSHGQEAAIESKAKQGIIMSIISLIPSVIATIVIVVLSISAFSKFNPDELHDYLNEAYEQTYGQSFDELYEEIYGEDFNEVYDELFENM